MKIGWVFLFTLAAIMACDGTKKGGQAAGGFEARQLGNRDYGQARTRYDTLAEAPNCESMRDGVIIYIGKEGEPKTEYDCNASKQTWVPVNKGLIAREIGEKGAVGLAGVAGEKGEKGDPDIETEKYRTEAKAAAAAA